MAEAQVQAAFDQRINQLKMIDEAYENAKAANSPDAEVLHQKAGALAAEIYNNPTPKTAPTIKDEAPATPPAPTMGSIAKDAWSTMNPVAQADAALNMGRGMIAAPVAGYTGMAQGAYNALGDATGLWKPGMPAGDRTRQVQEGITGEPFTQGGKDIVGAAGSIMSIPAKGADWAGEKTTDLTGSPLAGAAVNTAIQGGAMLLGAKAGPIMDAVNNSRLVRPAANLISDYLPGGADRAASRVMRTYAGTPADAQAAAAQLAIHRAGQSGALADKYGFEPTTAGVAQNAGLAQLERNLRGQGDTSSVFNTRDARNRQAATNILTDMSGTPAERLRASTARDVAARDAYDDALNNPEHFVQPPKAGEATFEEMMSNAQGAPAGAVPNGTPAGAPGLGPVKGMNPVGTQLQDLLQRPAMQDAMNNASRIAANFGKAIDNRNLIQQLHYAKMHLDDQIGAAARSGASNDLRSLMDTKNSLLDVMDQLSPAYADARRNFQVQSQPLNRMDVGEALKNRYMSALQETSGVGGTPSRFLDSLRNDNGDAIARTATGFGGARLQDILHPQDVEALGAIKDQLAADHYAQTAGRGVGSPTAQNLANERSLNNIGSLNTLSEDMGPAGNLTLALHHPAVAIPASVRGAAVRGAARQRIANAALNPADAEALLARHPFSWQDMAPMELTAPMTVGAHTIAANDDDGMAEGGQPEKSSFWDLVKQAYHEMTTPDDTSPASAPIGSGAAEHAAQQVGARPAQINAIVEQDS